jgi:hypothetical protein
MMSHYLYNDLAAARRNDLLAEARAARLARVAREARRARGTGRRAPGMPEATP